MSGQFTADQMLLAVAHDPQFAPPVRPRLVPGLTIVPMPNSVLFEGAHERQLLRGRSAVDFLPLLLAQLDGVRTADDVAAALRPKAPERATHAALALLYTSGLLEDGTPEAEDGGADGLDPHVLGHVSRMLDVTRVHRNGAVAARSLATARVGLLGDPAVREALERELRTSGLRHLVAFDATADVDRHELDLLIVADTDATRYCLAVHEHLAGHALPWLRVHVGATIEIGPRIEAGRTACFGCLARVVDEMAAPDDAPIGSVTMAMAAALAALEAVHLLSRIADPLSLSSVATLDSDSLEQSSWLVPRLPGCTGRCTAGIATQELPVSYVFEQAVAFPPRDQMSPKSHQTHYKQSNIDLQREHRSYPGAATVELPTVDHRAMLARPLWSPGPPTRLGLAELACLLDVTAGLKPSSPPSGSVLRFAPSGGNLGSVSAWVLGDVRGARPGVWFHQPFERRLQLVTTWTEETAQRLTSAGCPVAGSDVLVVLTGSLFKVGQKYGDFAYRIANLDAGVALAQAMATAAALGVGADRVESFDEAELGAVLGLDIHLEIVTGVFTLTAPPTESE